MDNNQHDKPTVNTGNNGEPSTSGIGEMDIDKTKQDQKGKREREVISESIEQLKLSLNTTNKDPVIHEQDVPKTNHATHIRMCTVQLEILTEVDIMKHVHVHRELKPKTVPLTKPGEAVETVETVETVHFTRSRTKTKLSRTNRLPRTASNNIAYVHLDDESDSGSSPSAKRKCKLRPKREPSSMRFKAVSFVTKSPSVRPLRRSTRTASLPSPSTNRAPTASRISNQTTPAVLTAASSDTGNTPKGAFSTQSFHLKKSKKTRKIGCKLCNTVCTSNKELTQHHQLKHNILYCDECSKAFNNPLIPGKTPVFSQGVKIQMY